MQKALISLFIILMSLSLSAMECDQLEDDCDYYSCIEEQRHCGKRGYPLNFGKKYCLKFNKEEDRFSEEGKRWIRDVRQCLIDQALESKDHLSCKEFKKEQFKAHVPCYIKTGYCELSRADRFAVKKVIYKSMWRPYLIWFGMKIVIKCRL
ncbi:putative exported protein [Halobacteriovorax marinus SJ]|uniref:Exported protein n=1 Tax=Halobacteriovorax marinus (strain ATCC BAA-682 / DSM 15412 / SJ) TaxID=862908 RepID=E1WXC5_HALMS|nr:hypothetical protein [Halobacteriovorax marinus]CBW25826.1 putative exported protein [Halobacteriovorax marinus SJ]